MATEPPDTTSPPEPTPPTQPPPPQPTIHEAEREPGLSGAVLRGAELDLAAAIARRQAGEDVVVCGSDTDTNRRLAYQVEAGVGTPSRPQAPHKSAGPMALPHFHQVNRTPDGHTFYETDKRKTRRKKP
jgi:hypothetical protein